METEINYTQLVVVSILGLAALIAVFFKGLREVISARFDVIASRIRRRQWSSGLGDTLGFLDAIDELGQSPGVDRFILFEGHNGGGVPKPGHPFTVKALRGKSHVPGKPDPLKMYDSEVTPDVHYFGMLQRIIKDDYLIIKKSELPPDSLLAGFYQEEGVAHSFVGFIDIVDAKMFYVSVAKYTGEFTALEILSIKRLLFKCRSRLSVSN